MGRRSIILSCVFLFAGMLACEFAAISPMPPIPTTAPREITATATPLPPTATELPLVTPVPMTTGIFYTIGGFDIKGDNRLHITNNLNWDAVVVFSFDWPAYNNPVFFAVYVQAGDDFINAINGGTFHVYVTYGKYWDPAARRFMKNASYFRFREPFALESNGVTYTFVTITLGGVGASSGIEDISPGDFPTIGPP